MTLLTIHKPLPSIWDSQEWPSMEELVEVKGLGVWGAEGNTLESELRGPEHQILTSLPVYIKHHLSNWPGMGPCKHVYIKSKGMFTDYAEYKCTV